jgi:phosphatidylserine decarboxylase
MSKQPMRAGLLLLLLLTSCALLKRPPRPSYASPSEAAKVEFPLVVPEHALTADGVTLRAINLAFEDFLPWDREPPRETPAGDVCFYQRDSYDVMAWREKEGIVFVSIYLRPETCDKSPSPLLDMGARYAIDTHEWRILAAQR